MQDFGLETVRAASARLREADDLLVSAQTAVAVATYDLRAEEATAHLDGVLTGTNAEQRRAQLFRHVAPLSLALDAAQERLARTRVLRDDAARLYELARWEVRLAQGGGDAEL